MKFFAVLSAVLAIAAATEEAAAPAPLTYTLPYAPYTYAAHHAPAYTYAQAPVTYTAAAAAPAVATYAAAAPVASYAPATYAAAYAPASYAAAYAPAVPAYTGSQFHAQDEFGNLNYGYSNLNSVKHEVGNTYGGVSGGYSYVDADNKLQTVQYVADAAGFRVADSRLPVAPVYDGVAPTFNPEPLVAPTFNPEPLVAPVYTGVAPEPVQDTPEVAAAKAAHLAAVAAEKADRKKREADPAVLGGYSSVLSAPTPLIHNAPVVTYAAAPYTAYNGLYHGGLYNGLYHGAYAAGYPFNG